jgi:hypothetical protein
MQLINLPGCLVAWVSGSCNALRIVRIATQTRHGEEVWITVIKLIMSPDTIFGDIFGKEVFPRNCCKENKS